jgi:hypothetical protein
LEAAAQALLVLMLQLMGAIQFFIQLRLQVEEKADRIQIQTLETAEAVVEEVLLISPTAAGLGFLGRVLRGEIPLFSLLHIQQRVAVAQARLEETLPVRLLAGLAAQVSLTRQEQALLA